MWQLIKDILIFLGFLKVKPPVHKELEEQKLKLEKKQKQLEKDSDTPAKDASDEEVSEFWKK